MQYSEVFDSYTKCETSKGTCGVLVFVEFVCGGGGGGGGCGGKGCAEQQCRLLFL